MIYRLPALADPIPGINRFATLLDVVNSYDTRFTLGLTAQEKLDLVEYLKSL